jgi:hypothetical protein
MNHLISIFINEWCLFVFITLFLKSVDWGCFADGPYTVGEHEAGGEPAEWTAACCSDGSHRDHAVWTGLPQYWVSQHKD